MPSSCLSKQNRWTIPDPNSDFHVALIWILGQSKLVCSSIKQKISFTCLVPVLPCIFIREREKFKSLCSFNQKYLAKGELFMLIFIADRDQANLLCLLPKVCLVNELWKPIAYLLLKSPNNECPSNQFLSCSNIPLNGFF